jgi:hypothetical protein
MGEPQSALDSLAADDLHALPAGSLLDRVAYLPPRRHRDPRRPAPTGPANDHDHGCIPSSHGSTVSSGHSPSHRAALAS